MMSVVLLLLIGVVAGVAFKDKMMQAVDYVKALKAKLLG